MELIGPYLIAGILLVAAGVSKVLHPWDTARALAPTVGIRLTATAVWVRVVSVAEVALGSTALVLPDRIVALTVAAAYTGLAGYVALVRRRGGPLASCGCFGTPDTPATRLHVVVNAALAASAAWVAASHLPGTTVSVLAHQPLHGVPLVAASALGAWLSYLAVAALADLQAARRLVGVSVGEPG